MSRFVYLLIQFFVYMVIILLPFLLALFALEPILYFLEEIGVYRGITSLWTSGTGKNTELELIVPLVMFIIGIGMSVVISKIYRKEIQPKLLQSINKKNNQQ